MKILQRLFKGKQDHKKPVPVRAAVDREEKTTRDLVLYNRGGACQTSSLGLPWNDNEESEDIIRIAIGKDDHSKTSFLKTLHLKRLRDLYYDKIHFWQKLSKDYCNELSKDIRTETSNGTIVELKVIPISAAATAELTAGREQRIKDDQQKRGKASKMKELLRWDAAAKTHNKPGSKWKVSYLPRKAALKAPQNDDRNMSTSSNIISSRWEFGNCSNSSSIFSSSSSSSLSSSSFSMSSASSRSSLACASMKSNQSFSKNEIGSTNIDTEERSFAPCQAITEDFVRVGSWITSDSNFLVLELRHDLEGEDKR